MSSRRLTIATRRSPLALWQAEYVKEQLQTQYPAWEVNLFPLETKGDRILDQTLAKIGGKGLFTAELERALKQGEADIAVHSAKDMPARFDDDFTLAAILARASSADALVTKPGMTWQQLPQGARVGTSSLRRQSQLLALRPDLDVIPVRGNVQTRLKKCFDDHLVDALILAEVGLQRLALDHHITHVFSPEEMLPAIGQGALAIQCMANASDLISDLQAIHDPQTTACVTAERVVGRTLGASCETPLAAFAYYEQETIHLRALIADDHGETILRAQASGTNPETLGNNVANDLLAQGAAKYITTSD